MTNLFDIKCPACGNTDNLHVVYEPLNTEVYLGPWLIPDEEKDARTLFQALMVDLWERWVCGGENWDLRKEEEVSNGEKSLPSETTWELPVVCRACMHQGWFSDFDKDRNVRVLRLEKAKALVHATLRAAFNGT